MIKIKRGLDIPILGAPQQVIEDAPAARSVALVGFDFAFGYPVGFARRLRSEAPDWRGVWKEITARVRDGEAWLEGVHVAPYSFAIGFGAHDPDRTRKLLLHRSEIVFALPGDSHAALWLDVAHFRRLLRDCTGHGHPQDEVCPHCMPLLSEAECQQLLVDWNATAMAYPRETTLAGRFEAQAAATPEAVALVFESYFAEEEPDEDDDEEEAESLPVEL